MYLKFLLIASVLGGVFAVCPPAEDIIPCTCDENRLRFYCNNQQYPEPWDMKATFDAITPLVPPDFVFNEILITVTNLKTIPAEAMQTIKFNKIYFEYNSELTYIHPDAFGETANVTTYFSMQYNNILTNEGEGHTDRDIFDVLSKFTAATDILIPNNKITKIPDEGFGPLPNLKYFKLGPWESVTRIGNRAFSQLPNLTSVSLNSCGIDIEDIADDAFEGIGPEVDMLLEFNPFMTMQEVPFKKLLDNAKSVAVGGYDCSWIGGLICYNYTLDCDETSAWICDDVEKYQPKLRGFYCSRNSRYEDIWEFCANRINNK